MSIVISVVSHNHFELIKNLKSLQKLSNTFKVFLIDNVKEDGFKDWCDIHNIHYIANDKKFGFGENNNIVFQTAFNNSPSDDDWFLILNPDVIVDSKSIFDLIENMKTDKTLLSTVNLYKNTEFNEYDNAVRNFPTIIDFAKSYLTGKNPSILDKSKITTATAVDWASGSFLMFNAKLYDQISGFDSNYFMYCEDIDICLRAKALYNQSVVFYPDIKAVHLAAHSNRKLFSKSFFWHVRSMIRYLTLKNKYKIYK
ncbi:hypothetical protein F4826_001392 [Rahnella inusitata]|nr:hypothetical protein [Rahnella inusitata]